jgi:3-dehydroquinate synthase
MEYLSGYSNELFHGEAVAKGILMAYRLSAHLGYATLNDVQRVENYFLSTGIDPLPTPWVECSDESKKKFLNAMMCDKKRINDQLNFILPKGIGKECVVFSTLPEMLLDFPIFD